MNAQGISTNAVATNNDIMQLIDYLYDEDDYIATLEMEKQTLSEDDINDMINQLYRVFHLSVASRHRNKKK